MRRDSLLEYFNDNPDSYPLFLPFHCKFLVCFLVPEFLLFIWNLLPSPMCSACLIWASFITWESSQNLSTFYKFCKQFCRIPAQYVKCFFKNILNIFTKLYIYATLMPRFFCYLYLLYHLNDGSVTEKNFW